VSQLLLEIQDAMLARATVFRDDNIHEPSTYADLKEVVADGWAFSWWCGSNECEAKVKEDTKATTRNIPLEGQPGGTSQCIVCGEKADKKVYFAKAY
jgi:prolyl-tRNA synthetase